MLLVCALALATHLPTYCVAQKTTVLLLLMRERKRHTGELISLFQGKEK